MLKYSNDLGRKVDYLSKELLLNETSRLTLVINTLDIFQDDIESRKIFSSPDQLSFLLEHLWLCFVLDFDDPQTYQICLRCLAIYHEILMKPNVQESIQSNCLLHLLLFFDERLETKYNSTLTTAQGSNPKKYNSNTQNRLKIHDSLIRIFLDITKTEIVDKHKYLLT